MSDEKIVVVGLGYVGLPTAALMANAGYQVHGVDLDPHILGALSEGRCPLGEPAVVRLVTEALASGQLTASSEIEEGDVYVICVPTPVTADKKADISIVDHVAHQISGIVRRGNLVILESTSPIGTTRDVVGAALGKSGLDILKDLDICYCPERVFPGSTVTEIVQNDRIIGGLTPRAAERAEALYKRFCTGTTLLTDAGTAEFSKLMENTYRDVNIALANVFSHIAERSGVNVHDAIELANRHPRVNVHKPGPGVGGHCIPVDPWFLIDGFPEDTALLRQARDINDGQPKRLWERVKSLGHPIKHVAILGAAYRGDLDDARESPTEKLIEALEAEAISYALHDPHVTSFQLHNGREVQITAHMETALSNADAVIIMTDHSQYKLLNSINFSAMSGRVIADGRDLLDPSAIKSAGYTVLSIGNAWTGGE